MAADLSPRPTMRRCTESEAVHALVARCDGRVIGMALYRFHRSTTRLTDAGYLQDGLTAEPARGQGVGRRLIEAAGAAAKAAGSSRVYGQTHVDNAPGRALDDRVAEPTGFIVYAHELS